MSIKHKLAMSFTSWDTKSTKKRYDKTAGRNLETKKAVDNLLGRTVLPGSYGVDRKRSQYGYIANGFEKRRKGGK